MIDQIEAALLGGVAATAGKITSKAVDDAYNALKGVFVRKLGKHSPMVESIAKLEDNPSSRGRQMVMAEELRSTQINASDFVTAARLLQEALNELPSESRNQVQNAVGKYISQASGGSNATVNFYSKT